MSNHIDSGAMNAHGRSARMGRVLVAGLAVGLPIVTTALLSVAYYQHRAEAALPPVPVPAANPITESKRVLGKMLFWDEQMSTSNVVSCGTCHSPSRAGADPRIARHPGDDGALNTADDILGSPGIIRSDSDNDFERDAIFALNPQITERAANVNINAAYAPLLFWDGRASGQFVDPQTGATVIANGGALESQAAGPLVNNVEMAHAGWDWPRLIAKLQRVKPLALSTNVPTDVQAARQANGNYPALFAAAFGDSQITASRIAMAIATYQRTLISDQSPFDAFRAGNINALTVQQRQGFNDFQANNCSVCHSVTQDLFTDHTFRNIGLRPVAEDSGRQAVTGNVNDRGRFKVPTLRNVALKATFMHNGQFQNLNQVLAFYARAPGAPVQQADNRDPVMNTIVPMPPQESQNIVAFLSSLTDPRVANQTFPFDRPLLFADRPGDRSVNLGGGVPGSGGVVPQVIVQAPTMIDNAEYRVGLTGALGGANVRLAVSRNAPVNGRITPEWFMTGKVASGAGNGNGVATEHWPLSLVNVQPGQRLFVQWHVTDAAAAGGVAMSSVGQLTFFCGSLGCGCDPIDFNRNGVFPEDADVIDFFNVLAGGPCTVSDVSLPQCDMDFNNNGVFPEDEDVVDFFNVLAGGSC
ncbi:MAG TPA: cytochrome c peroxidase [Phycisphaerales bacterium]|nr:cytochrome c peroxidase [Phycisphaerales bacterium]